MLQLQLDRVGKGFCSRCQWEIPKNTIYVDTAFSFGGGYGQLCTDCEDVSDGLYYLHILAWDARRYIEDLENGRWEKWPGEMEEYVGEAHRKDLEAMKKLLTGNPWRGN